VSFGAKAVTPVGSGNEISFPILRAASTKSKGTKMDIAFRPIFPLLMLCPLLLLSPAVSQAQSLGEVARQYRKELKEREKKGEVPVRVFTNDDIARMPPIAIVGPSGGRAAEPGTKRPVTSQQPSAEATVEPTPAKGGKSQGGARSKEYWQARFKAARAVLEHAKEEQTLVEDELQLLQIQQVRELNPDRKKILTSKIDASTIELEAKRAATNKAQAALDELEKEFKKSGAPEDWIQDNAMRD
jgi:hypothetical protein